MLEKISRFQRTDEPVIETGEDAGDVHGLLITHGLLLPGQAAPHLKTNTDLHFIIVRGTLALRVADQNIHIYEAGTIITVPSGVVMEARNKGTGPLEFFEIKSPHPDGCLL